MGITELEMAVTLSSELEGMSMFTSRYHSELLNKYATHIISFLFIFVSLQESHSTDVITILMLPPLANIYCYCCCY
jgi:hypothetical protein